ncbi:hypothetical protein [Terrihabitans sp. B22-R8]|uniref:hypothetical protein n=1 Tax=Terrihabitans sp. B22-R8 TaxID=3425128 RepID=UPI00403D0551
MTSDPRPDQIKRNAAMRDTSDEQHERVDAVSEAIFDAISAGVGDPDRYSDLPPQDQAKMRPVAKAAIAATMVSIADEVAAFWNGKAERWQHVRSGGFYSIIGAARLQLDGPDDEAEMVIYRSEADGSVWVRRKSEFMDGRFVRTSGQTEGA